MSEIVIPKIVYEKSLIMIEMEETLRESDELIKKIDKLTEKFLTVLYKHNT